MKRILFLSLLLVYLCSCTIIQRNRSYLDLAKPELKLGKLADSIQLSEYQVKWFFDVNIYPPFWTDESKAFNILDNIERSRRAEKENSLIRAELFAEQTEREIKAEVAAKQPKSQEKKNNEYVVSILGGLYYHSTLDLDSTHQVVTNRYFWGLFDSNQ